jgi:tetratricopeptide (TPR) repeat protein
MKKSSLLLIILFILAVRSYGQLSPHEITLLKNKLAAATSDSLRINLLIDLSNAYRFSHIDSALTFAENAIEQSRQIGQPVLEGYALSQKGYILLEIGEIPQSLQNQFMALNIAERTKNSYLEAWCMNRIGNAYMELRDFSKAVDYYRSSKYLFVLHKKEGFVYNEISNIGNVYEMMGLLDSSKIYQQQLLKYSLTNSDRYAVTYGEMRERLGNVERHLGNYDSAVMHYRIGIKESLFDFDYRNLAANYLQLTKVFHLQKRYDSGFYYAKKTIDVARLVSWKKAIYEASGLLTNMYQSVGRPDSALRYAELNIAVRDSLYGPEKVRQLQRITLREQERQLQLEKETADLQNKYQVLALLSALGVVLYSGNRLVAKQSQETNRQSSFERTKRSDISPAK